MKRIHLALFSLILFGATAWAQNSQAVSFVIPSVIHDVFPCVPDQWPDSRRAPDGTPMNYTLCTPDVESYVNDVETTGMVATTLTADRKLKYLDAVWNGRSNRQATNSTTYNWLWNVPVGNGHSKEIPYDFKMTNVDPANSDVYEFNDQAFYPINNRGWGNLKGYDRNYHFCLEVHAYFTYRGGEVLNFTGDDDLYIFIDNRLGMDIGGVHPPRSGILRVDNMGLKKGYTYNFDVFYCERHTVLSTIRVQSTIAVYCPPEQIDFCGICNGNGDCCPTKCVRDNCRTSILNPKDCTCTVADDKNKEYECAQQNNKCYTYKCNPAGGCTQTAIPNPEAGNPCYDSKCNNTIGWINTPKSNICTRDQCKPDNECVKGQNPLFPSTSPDYYCKYTNSCTGFCQNRPQLVQQCDNMPKNACTKWVCSDAEEKCVQLNLVQPPTVDKCTNATCDPVTGVYSYTPKDCPGNLCALGTCNTTTGECEVVPNPCDDFNACTDNLCDPSNGTCYYQPTDLSKFSAGDNCLTATCNPSTGVHLTRLGSDETPCPNAGRCKPDPTVAGCCVCQPAGLGVGAIAGISAGVIAGAVIGAVAGAALLGVGGKVGYDYFQANAGNSGNIQNNPLYTETGARNNPLAD